jgi:tetratricopeptide (TPR) repeat protein
MEKRYWGKHNEYGPFSTQADGWPRRGEIVRFYRKRLNMSAQRLGELYGNAVYGHPVSERWIHKMERDNMVPANRKRLGLLAGILGIPALLLGEGSLRELQPEEPQQKAQGSRTLTPFNASAFLGQHERLLNLYWKLDYTSTAQTSLTEITETIADLKILASKVQSEDQQKIYELLSGFYPLASTISNDLGNFSEAYTYADDGLSLATSIQNNKLIAASQYQRGFVSLQWGTAYGTAIDQRKVTAAITDFEAARPLAVPRVEAAILLDLAFAQAINRQKTAATTSLDLAGKITNRSGLDEGNFLDLFANLSKGRYHLGRALVFTSLKDYDEAESELDLADTLISQDQTRRHAWIDILRAKVYVGQRSYSIATEYASSALLAAKSIHSVNNIKLVQEVYQQLLTSTYKNAQPVRDLGTALVLP